MPTILTLQGPNLSLLGTSMPDLLGPLAGSIAGPIDTIKEHPWALLIGLFAGGWLASKYAPAWGGTWGAQAQAHRRETSFHGHGPKKRRRR